MVLGWTYGLWTHVLIAQNKTELMDALQLITSNHSQPCLMPSEQSFNHSNGENQLFFDELILTSTLY
jgi:hypothetical protein